MLVLGLLIAAIGIYLVYALVHPEKLMIRQERVRSDNHGKEGNEALKNR